MPDSNGWWPTCYSISTCCRRRCEKKSEARPAPGTGSVVSRDVPDEWCAGLSVGQVWSGILVSEESGKGSDGSQAAHSRPRPCPTSVWVSAHLGVASPRRLCRQPQAGAALVPPGWASVVHARAATQTYRAASRPSSSASQSPGTVEYGLRA